MSIATLSIDLEVKLAKLQEGLDKAGRMAEKSSQQMRDYFSGIGAAFTRVGATAGGVVAVGAAIHQFVKTNAEAIDALNDVADATGASIEKISGLEQVAMRTGATLDTVSGLLIKFNKALSEGNPNGPLTQTLKSIGLSAAELQKIDPAEALRQTAIALAGYADDGNKARLIQELFGKSVKEAAPFLKDLAESGELNAKITAAQAEQAEKFNKQLSELKTNSVNAARALASDLIPEINGLFDRFKDNGVKGLFGVTKLKEEMADLNLARFKVGVAAVELAAAEKNAFKALANPEGYQADIEARKAAYAAAVARAEALQSKFYRLTEGQAGGGRGFVNPETARPSVGPGVSKPDAAALQEAKAYENLIKKLRERLDISTQELATGEKLTESEKLRLDVMAELSASKLTEPHKAAVKAMLERAVAAGKLRETQIESIKLDSQEARVVANLAMALNDQTNSMREQAEEVGLSVRQLEALRNARMEEAIARKEQQLAALQALSTDGKEFAGMQLNIDAMRELLRLKKLLDDKRAAIAESPTLGAQAALNEYATKVKEAGVATKDALSQSLQSAEDELVNFFRTGELNAAKFADEVIAQILRIAVVRPLVNSVAGSIGAFLGIPGLSADGNAFDASGKVTGFASGGVFDKATAFTYGGGSLGVLGEAGPEGVLPLKRGQDGKLGVINHSSGRVINLTYAPVFHVDGTADRAQSLSDMQKVSQQSSRELLQFLKAKGVY